MLPRLLYFLVLTALIFQSCKNPTPKVQVIGFFSEESAPSSHGMNKLLAALDSMEVDVLQVSEPNAAAADYYIFAGLSSTENHATKTLKDMQVSLPVEKEALVIQQTKYNEKPALMLCGADEVGLMFATLDVAKRVSWIDDAGNLFEHVKNVVESPYVKERAVSAGTFQRRYFEEKLYDTQYWEKYFDMMAENRLNQFLLIFGYKNNQMREPNFMAPAYPNFFNVEEFPYVKMSNVTPEQQKKNTKALKKVIAKAHERGIEFGIGLWDQIERDGRFRKIVKSDEEMPEDLAPNIIWGLTHDNLIPYTKIAMRKFFQTFPEIDLVQFRMHWESGITGDVALKFWKETFNILKEENPNLKIEARAKDVPDETLYDGVETEMDFRVATKHWMEQMGMPFHPTHINKDNQFDRRHGYADLLRYPKRYGFKWRVWSGGTTRAFLWGDPEWVKVFSEGSHLYDAVGFEFNEPLYFKMNGSKHDAEVSELLNPANRYYTNEFERYWHYFQVMGRVGYNPETPSDIWEMEFNQRFGKEAGPLLMDALHKASKVLPRIVSASYLYPRFASPQGWPELQRMEDLKHFASNSRPSDIQQFGNVREEAEQILNGEFSVKRNPSQISDWFSETSKDILSNVQKAEAFVGGNPSKEFISTVTDLKMLANLAKYHAHRLNAAVQYNLYTKTGDLVSFDKAIKFESQAVDAYGNLVAAAGDIYNMQLDFGSNKALFPGHWKNEYQRLVEELENLRSERDSLSTSKNSSTLLAHIPILKIDTKMPIQVSATLLSPKGIQLARVMYSVDENEFIPVEMNISDEGIAIAEIPNTGKEGILKYYIEIIYPTGGKEFLPKYAVEAPYRFIISSDTKVPEVEVERITTAQLDNELKVTAEVADPSGIQFVNLRYRRVTQFEDYELIQMEMNTVSGKYEAVFPAEFFDGKYDVMYFIEAMDTKGNGRMYPDLETETPYVIVNLER